MIPDGTLKTTKKLRIKLILMLPIVNTGNK